jgi:hypothetical protein
MFLAAEDSNYADLRAVALTFIIQSQRPVNAVTGKVDSVPKALVRLRDYTSK